MTREQKAIAYNDAIEKAKEYLNSPRTCFDIEQLYDIFPELKEPEDESTREKLIGKACKWLSQTDFCHYYNKGFIDEFRKAMEE